MHERPSIKLKAQRARSIQFDGKPERVYVYLFRIGLFGIFNDGMVRLAANVDSVEQLLATEFLMHQLRLCLPRFYKFEELPY